MACKHPPIPKSSGKNWIERVPGGHIPEPIDCIARALYHTPGSKAMGNKQKAYEMAVGIAHNFAHGQNIGAAKQAKYVKALAEWEALRAASKARTAAKNLSVEDADQGERVVIDLAARMKGLYDVNATIARLKRNPKLKKLSDSDLQRIALARILRRQLRNKLGITDLKNLSPAQQAALKKAGLVGGGKSAVGQTVTYTLQRGPRKGQTITIKRTASGWHEVRPHTTTTSKVKVA